MPDSYSCVICGDDLSDDTIINLSRWEFNPSGPGHTIDSVADLCTDCADSLVEDVEGLLP